MRHLFCVCIFLCCTAVALGYKSPTLQCRDKEIVRCVDECPPERTCENRRIAFKCAAPEKPCQMKCVCKDGYVRNSVGDCIKERRCGPQCRDKEVVRCVHECPPEKTCSNRHIAFSCAAPQEPCQQRCVCKNGYVRNTVGDCVKEGRCDQCAGPNEHFACGGACDNVCATLQQQNQTNCPIVNVRCNDRCYCDPGHARDGNNICVPIADCPWKPQPGRYTDIQTPKPGKQCTKRIKCSGPNEMYTSCKKKCPPETCATISGFIVCDPKEECKPGCICKSGYLRREEGAACMPTRECPQLANAPEYQNPPKYWPYN